MSYIYIQQKMLYVHYMAVPQFTLVPYDLDKITYGILGPLGVSTIWTILTCGRYTVKGLMTGRYANRFLNRCPVFI